MCLALNQIPSPRYSPTTPSDIQSKPKNTTAGHPPLNVPLASYLNSLHNHHSLTFFPFFLCFFTTALSDISIHPLREVSFKNAAEQAFGNAKLNVGEDKLLLQFAEKGVCVCVRERGFSLLIKFN